MPLLPGKSKKAFSKNVETEMKHGKPMDQSLAIAYSVKRKNKKPKKMAEGGNVNAKNERRPMPDNRYDDAKMDARNSGNKPPKDDSWSSNITLKQAQKPSITKLSQPKIIGSDAFSVRNRDMHEDEADMMDRIHPESDLAQPPQRDNEDGPNRQGPKVPDMAAQHKAKRPPYNKAIEDQYAQDMAAAEMKKRQSYAQGGPVMEPEDSGLELMERSDEAHLQSMESPSEDEGSQEAHSLNEEDSMGHNDHLDMEDQHNSGRKPYYMGGPAVKEDHPHLMFDDAGENEDHILELNAAHDKHSADDSEDQPRAEEDMEHEDSIAAAIMSKKHRGSQSSGSPDDDHAVMMAEGGDIHSHGSMDSDDSDQADLSRNADEDANEEDQASFDALRKENYSESAGLKQLDSPMDSAQMGDEEEDESENKHDKIDKMRSRMNARRQFKQR